MSTAANGHTSVTIHLSRPLSVVAHKSRSQHEQCFTDGVRQLFIMRVRVLVASYAPMKKVSGAPSPVNSSTVPGSNLSQSPTASTNRPESWKRMLSLPNPHYEAHTCDRSLKQCLRFYYLTDGRERVRTLIAGTTQSSTFFSSSPLRFCAALVSSCGYTGSWCSKPVFKRLPEMF